MPKDLQENVIEWITGEDIMTCTFTQRKYVTKVKKLAVKYPKLVSISHENRDGSILCHLPLSALKLYLKTGVYEGVENGVTDGEI